MQENKYIVKNREIIDILIFSKFFDIYFRNLSLRFYEVDFKYIKFLVDKGVDLKMINLGIIKKENESFIAFFTNTFTGEYNTFTYYECPKFLRKKLKN